MLSDLTRDELLKGLQDAGVEISIPGTIENLRILAGPLVERGLMPGVSRATSWDVMLVETRSSIVSILCSEASTAEAAREHAIELAEDGRVDWDASSIVAEEPAPR